MDEQSMNITTTGSVTEGVTVSNADQLDDKSIMRDFDLATAYTTAMAFIVDVSRTDEEV